MRPQVRHARRHLEVEKGVAGRPPLVLHVDALDELVERPLKQVRYGALYFRPLRQRQRVTQDSCVCTLGSEAWHNVAPISASLH